MLRSLKAQRITARVLLLTFANLVSLPLQAGAQAKELQDKLPQEYVQKLAQLRNAGAAQQLAKPVPVAPVALDPQQQARQLLKGIHQDLKALAPASAFARPAVPKARALALGAAASSDAQAKGNAQTAVRASMLSATAAATRSNAMLDKHAQLTQLYAQIEQDFKQEEAQFKKAGFSAQIIKRQQEAHDQFVNRKTEFDHLMKQLAAARTEKERNDALNACAAFLQNYPAESAHQFTNPDKLPARTPNKTTRPPATDSAQLAALFPTQYREVKLAGAWPDGLQLSAVGAAVEPGSAELGENEEVRFTYPVRQQALALNKDPLKIYEWVRNNIQFVPNYGSIQGADMTLLTRRGNAFDTASLLIALLRASGHGARYVYGTIDVPIEQAMNWVGGLTQPDQVQSLLSQGGIPSVSVLEGGRVRAVRMEHVWVEAWLDFTPARAAKNANPKNWIPLDASFKQFQYRQKVDVASLQPFDMQSVMADLKQGATIGDGYVQNLNMAKLDTFYRAYVNQVDAKLIAAGMNPGIDDLLSKPQVIPQNLALLAGTLPYKVLLEGSKMAELKNTLRHYAQVSLYASEFDQAMDAPTMNYRISLPALNLQRLGISYKPASDADAQVLQNARNNKASSLPVYSVNVVPNVELDGKSVATGPVVRMGSPQLFRVVLQDPQGINTDPADFKRVAGDEIVVGINAAGVSEEMIRARFTEFPNQSTAAENLFQSALGYWLMSDTYDWKTAQQTGTVAMRMPSVGFFTAGLSINYFFGIPRSGAYKGRSMDVPRVVTALAGGNAQIRRNFMSQSGLQGSFFEGYVFDHLFTTGVGQSVSAVQLIQSAAAQGLKIYQLNAQNWQSILPALQISEDVKYDLRIALEGGKQVIVPEKEIAHNNYSGVGYIVQDTTTGAGAYMIDGGLNGGINCEKSEATEPAATKIGEGILFVALLVMAIALAVALVGAVIVVVGAVVAGAAEVLAVGGTLLLSLVALPAAAANEPRPPLNRKPDGTLEKPGRCTPSQHAALEAAKDAACDPIKGKSCKGVKPDDIGCTDLKSRVDGFNACIAARQAVIFSCFESGDHGHWQQIADLQTAMGYCVALYNTKKCDDC